MSNVEIVELCRVIVVIALVVIAAVLATPPNKVPLALRGLVRILKLDGLGDAAGETHRGTYQTPYRGASSPEQPSEATQPQAAGNSPVPTWKKLLSFALCILAFIIAKI